jgi:hypothetical protein
MMCSVARSLQAFTATPSKNHGHLGHFTATKFFYQCHIHSQIFIPSIFCSPDDASLNEVS